MSHARIVLLILVLWVAGLGAAGQFAKMAVILPELDAIYPGRGAGIGFLISIISLLGVVFGVLAGSLGSRVGPRRLLLASLVLGALVSLAQGALPPFPVMMALRTVEGLSHLGIVVSAPTLIGGFAPPAWRGAAMTLWGTFFGVAFAAVALWGVPLVRDHGAGALFLAHAAVMIAVCVVLARILPRDGGAGRTRRAMPATGASAVQALHRNAYGSPRVAAPALGWLFYTLVFGAMLAVLPTLVPPDARSAVAATMPIASIITSMTVGVALLRIVSPIGVIAVGFAAAIALVPLLLVLPGSTWVPVALLGALGLVQGASFAAVPYLNSDTDDQALANGALAQTGNTGNLLGTPLMLGALQVAGVPGLVGLVMVACALGLAAHALMARARRVVAA